MVRFIGVKQARPLALCAQGANQHAHALFTKSRKAADPAPSSETVLEITDMEKAILKKALLWNETTKAYFAGLEGAAEDTFLAKSADEQNAEALAAKTAADEAAAAARALETGKSVRELALEKRLNDQDAVIKSLQDANAESVIKSRAATEFAGYPGGVEKAVSMLKTAAKLEGDDRDNFEKSMKDAIAAAKMATRTFGAFNAEKTSAMPATKKISDEAAKIAAEKGISTNAAMLQLSEDPKWAPDFAAATEERSAAA